MNSSNPFEFILYLLSLISSGFTGIVNFFNQPISDWASSFDTGNVFIDTILDFISNALDYVKIGEVALGSVSVISLIFGTSLPILLVLTVVHWLLRLK